MTFLKYYTLFWLCFNLIVSLIRVGADEELDDGVKVFFVVFGLLLILMPQIAYVIFS